MLKLFIFARAFPLLFGLGRVFVLMFVAVFACLWMVACHDQPPQSAAVAQQKTAAKESIYRKHNTASRRALRGLAGSIDSGINAASRQPNFQRSNQ